MTLQLPCQVDAEPILEPVRQVLWRRCVDCSCRVSYVEWYTRGRRQVSRRCYARGVQALQHAGKIYELIDPCTDGVVRCPQCHHHVMCAFENDVFPFHPLLSHFLSPSPCCAALFAVVFLQPCTLTGFDVSPWSRCSITTCGGVRTRTASCWSLDVTKGVRVNVTCDNATAQTRQACDPCPAFCNSTACSQVCSRCLVWSRPPLLPSSLSPLCAVFSAWCINSVTVVRLLY
jgi:hypothetical protein